MPQLYATIVTDIGLAAFANAALTGTKIDITHFAVGDGGGGYYMPGETMTTLKRETWRGIITKKLIPQDSPNVIEITTVIPSDTGGFTIREVAVFDDKNNMIAIANTANIEKVSLSQGMSSDFEITMQLRTEHAAVVNIIVDPNVIIATKKDIEEHNRDPEAHSGINNHFTNEALHVSPGEQLRWDNASKLSISNKIEIDSLRLEIERLASNLAWFKDALFGEIVGNPHEIKFDDLTGIKLVKGIWNKERKRVEC